MILLVRNSNEVVLNTSKARVKIYDKFGWKEEREESLFMPRKFR